MQTGANNSSNMSNLDSNITAEHAQALHDIASNGTVDEHNTYGYSNGTTNGQQNGTDFDDMDSAALLESLANFEQPKPTEAPTHHNANENDSFERLLQAAATAGGQEADENAGDLSHSDVDNTDSLFNSSPEATREKASLDNDNSTKRKRSEEPNQTPTRPGKRQKAAEAEFEAQQAKEREIWGTEEYDEYDYDDASRYEGTPGVSSVDARSMGVHSAAALFRRPSEKSKKHTRPPMARLFSSLQITAEEFIHLQAAAKEFMLDEKHPDRYECVGSKEKGDTDMTKLKLFGCVKMFLDNGWGERLWGKGATEPEKQTLKWPGSEKRITSLITPLLRRMVTNERQRRYASEVRVKKQAQKRREAAQQKSQIIGQSPTPNPDVDPKLDEYHYKVAPHLPAELVEDQLDVPMVPAPEEDGVKYHVNITQNDRRIKPRLTLTPSTCPGYSNLVQHIDTLLADGNQKRKSIKVLGPYGQVEIDNEDAWRETVDVVQEKEWMDGDIKVIVLVEEKS